MKKILFIAPDSYPINGAESIVNTKLLAALSSSRQFQIDLISKNSKTKDYATDSLKDLGVELNSLHIIEVDNKLSIRAIKGHIESLIKFGVVFKGSHWAVEALKVAVNLCRSNKYDYVLTKNASAPLVGAYLQRKFGIKWVATWNDPYPHFTYPPIYADFFHAKKNLISLRVIQIIRKADIHVFPNTYLRDHLLPYYNLDVNKTVIIPHIAAQSVDDKHKVISGLRLIHSGNIAYPRDASVFLEGLKMFIDKHPTVSIRFDILGVCDKVTADNVIRLKLDKYVRILPPVSYKQSLSVLKNYNIAVIIEAILDKGIFLPTKVSDFMQEHMPIFAISPKMGVLKELYDKKYINYFANNTSSEDVYNSLCNILYDLENNSIVSSNIPVSYTPDEVVKVYSKL